MLHNLSKESWERALERDKKLKDLAVKAGVANNYERAKELNGCFAFNGGDNVVKSEEERYRFTFYLIQKRQKICKLNYLIK